MDSCLSTDFILREIISKLNLREKFSAQGVCLQWKDIAIECLLHHKYLVISENPPSDFWCHNNCDEHPFMDTVNNDNLISSKLIDLEFWQRTLSLLQGVKFVYIDVPFDDDGNRLFSAYKPILQLLIDSYGQLIECLRIRGHDDEDDETFPLTDFLPRLKHLLLTHTTSQVTKNILTACPNLEYLCSSTSFTEWQMLPKGFKKLESHSKDLNGMNNLLCSPAVESLEVVKRFVMTSEICYQSYHLSRLKEFYVTIDFDVTSCLTHLARILSFAPVLRQLTINIQDHDEIEPQAWINVLSECQTLTHLKVILVDLFDTGFSESNVSSWQDDFAKTVVSKVKKLEYLDITFPFSSDGLRLLERLENLKSFRHGLYTKNMAYDGVFDTDALTDFLSSSLDKNLTEYYISIPYGEHLELRESFYDFIEKMERKHFVRFEIWQNEYNGIERVQPDIPGMIYVTGLKVNECDLISC